MAKRAIAVWALVVGLAACGAVDPDEPEDTDQVEEAVDGEADRKGVPSTRPDPEERVDAGATPIVGGVDEPMPFPGCDNCPEPPRIGKRILPAH